MRLESDSKRTRFAPDRQCDLDLAVRPDASFKTVIVLIGIYRFVSSRSFALLERIVATLTAKHALKAAALSSKQPHRH